MRCGDEGCGRGVGEDVCVWDEFVEDAARFENHALVVAFGHFDAVGYPADLLDAARVEEVQGFGEADLVVEDKLDFAAGGFPLGGRA